MLNSTNTYYKGVGNSTQPTEGLPLQTIPKSKKTPQWEKDCMDRLEEIGTHQVADNYEFRDYYRMTEGSVVYADYQPTPEVTRDIVNLRNEVKLPSYIKHFDLIGVIVNQLIGEYDSHRDKIRIDSLDEFAQNEYLRTKNRKLQSYLKESFDLEIKTTLAMQGVAMDKTDFKSEEERQQYLQALEQKKNSIVPPSQIQRSINKDFKVRIVEWAEHVWEADRQRFGLSHLEKKELKDYLLTGRYFRHYHLGFDYYKPEHWRPEETFFSQDVDSEFPQDGEYVGRVFRLSSSDIIQRYGHKLTHKQQIQISKELSSGRETTEKYNITNPSKRPVKEVREPLGYETFEMTEQFQDAFNQPLGQATYVGRDGDENTVPYWIEGYNDGGGFLANNFSVGLRDDINVRKDTYQITEAYWRGQKLVAFLYYEDDRGIPDMEMVSEDVLNDFLKENNIKKLKSVAIDNFLKDPELNTICYTYVPQIYKGKKIRGVGSGKDGDIYFDIEELDFQIKGDSNIYDLKLPVSGYIGSSFAKRLRPYQFGYNIAMNQITNLLEKEIGMFFLMDINFLPSEFKEMGDSKDILTELKTMAKEIGFMPVDTSKKNLQSGNPNTNSFIKQNITYAEEVQYRIGLSDKYKQLALEQIGLTPQRMMSPSGSETAEGIRQEVSASYAQTDNIYAPFNEAQKKTTEIHLNVAQYAEKNDKDISVFYRKNDDELATMHFQDEFFHLRQLGVTAVSDSKTRKNIEQLRNVLLNNNTMGSDMLEYAELFTADSMVELVSIGRRNRAEKQKLEQAQNEHELQLLDKQAQNQEAQAQREYQREEASKERDRQVDLEEARIKALGDAVDNNADNSKIQYLSKTIDQRINKEKNDRELDIRKDELSHKKEMDKKENNLKEQEMSLKIKELQTKMAEIKANKSIARMNKN